MIAALSIEGQLLSTIMDESEIEYLVKEIEQHDHLMEDNAFGQQLRTYVEYYIFLFVPYFLMFSNFSDILRALPQSMNVKREIKAKVNHTISNRTKELGETKWTKLKYLIGVWYTSTRVFSRNIFIDFELWYGPMKEIEGHFGGGVGTYFKFLRYLFILNLILMIFSFG